MAIQITSLIIRRKTLLYWSCIGSDSPLVRNANAYEGTIFADFLTIKTATGAIIYEDVPYNVVKYYDDLNPANNLLNPASAEALQIHLLNQGFYQSSSEGGSGATTFFGGLSDTPATATGRNGQLLYVNNGVVDTQQPFEGALQDNTLIRKVFIVDTPTITMPQALVAINNIPAYVVNEYQEVIFVSRYFGYSSGLTTLVPIYKIVRLNKGKGTYGLGAQQLSINDLELVFVQNHATPQDIEDDPTTDVIPFFDLITDEGQTGEEAVSEWLNNFELSYDIQPQNEGYTLFKGTVNGVETSYLWVGTSGTYGSGELQSVASDFQILEDNVVSGIVQSVTGDLVDNTNPANPVINERKDVPFDILMSCTTDSSLINYKTDIYRTFDLEDYLPEDEPVYITSQIVRLEGNDFFIVANSSYGYVLCITLRDCYIQNNLFGIGSVLHRRITEPVPVPPDGFIVENRIHGALYNRGFMYLSSRHDNSAIGQRLWRVDPYNLEHVTVATLPITAPYTGQTTEIRMYRNWVYMLITAGATQADYIVRIDENLNLSSLESIQLLGLTTTRKIGNLYPFIIYNDEIYIPTTNTTTSGYNLMGVDVYSMVGGLNRSVEGLVIGTGFTQRYIPHWLTVYNGKLFVTTTGNLDRPQFVARIDTKTLALEQYLPLTNIVTHRNSLLGGYLYLSQDAFYDVESGNSQLLKINAMDFTDYSVELDPYGVDGKGSYGSIDPLVPQESLKTKLSQFQNDIGAGTAQNLQQVTAVGAVTTIPLRVKDVTTAEETSYSDNGHLYKDASGNVVVVEHNAPIVPAVKYAIPAKSTNDTFAMISDVGSAFEPYDTFSDFPPTGVEGILYLDEESLKLYVWDDVNDVYVGVNSTSGFVPYQGATEPLNLGEQPLYFYKVDGFVTTDASYDSESIVKNKLTFTGVIDDLTNIEFKSESIREGSVLIGASKTVNGSNTQSSLKLDIIDFNRPTIKTENHGLEFDIPAGKELKYTNTPLIDSPISIPTKEYTDTKNQKLVAGTNITIVDNGNGTETISSTGGGGGGATNLSYTPSPTQGQVNSDTGADAVIPAADSTNAGLLLPAEKTKIANVPSDTNASLAEKQATLVSGTNIKTIEGQSLLGAGNIDLNKSDVGLANVDNTSDANKPVSTAQQTALNGKVSVGGDTLGANLTIGTMDSNDIRIIRNNTVQLLITSTNVGLREGATFGNSTNVNRFSLTSGANASPATWTRNLADAVSAAVINLQNTGSTGKILELQFNGTTKASIDRLGNIEVTDATAGVILKSPNGTRYRITVNDAGTLVTTIVV